jgi:anti-sigma B factor antagonist
MDIASEKHGNVVILFLTGHIDFEKEEKINSEISTQLNDQNYNIVINMSSISAINSQGLSILINAQKKVKNLGGDIKISGLQLTIKELFELTRLQDVFEIYETNDQAVASYKSTNYGQ